MDEPILTEEAPVYTRRPFGTVETRQCGRPGCGQTFIRKRATNHLKVFCSQACRERVYWDSGRGREARKAHASEPKGPRKPPEMEIKKVRPRKPAAITHPPVVNTHIAGSIARAMLYGDRVQTVSLAHSPGPAAAHR